MNKYQLLVPVITFEMKASVATAIALASSSVASGKYSLYRSYNTLYTSAFLSPSLYSSDFIFQRQVATYICQLSPADFNGHFLLSFQP